MRVEQGRGETLLALGQAELHTEPLEPFASIVGDETLQSDEVDEMPRILRGLEQLPSLIGNFPGGVDVAGEVRQVSLRAQDRAVRGVTFLGKPSQRSPCGVKVTGKSGCAGQPGPDEPMLGSTGDSNRILVRLDRFWV